MEPVTTLTGTAAAIRRANIDTDQIIPAAWMKRVSRTGYADGLFQTWRTDLTFEHEAAITAHEDARAVAEPWLPTGRP